MIVDVYDNIFLQGLKNSTVWRFDVQPFGCQHFYLTSSAVLLQHRWTKRTPLTLRMAKLLNIHVAGVPTVPVIPKITMSNMGLLSRAVNRSQVANPTNMGPEDYNAAAFNNQDDVWWLAMPTEMFEAMTPPTGIPTTLKGNRMSPRWDKLILSATPTLAMFTLFFSPNGASFWKLQLEQGEADVPGHQPGTTKKENGTIHGKPF